MILVLLDELGAGTDPQEGSALARAIVGPAAGSGAAGGGDDTYPEVRHSPLPRRVWRTPASSSMWQPRRERARLMIGVPGRSNALAIAGRLGIQADVLTHARDAQTRTSSGLIHCTGHRRRREEADAAVERAQSREKAAENLRELARRELATPNSRGGPPAMRHWRKPSRSWRRRGTR